MKLDFAIVDTHNSKTFCFIDESDFRDNSPVFPTLQFRFPDLQTVYKCLIKPNQKNTIFTTTIGWSTTSVDFPDGVYTLQYSVSPHNKYHVQKKYIKTDMAYNELKKINSEITEKDSKYFSKLAEIELLLTSCKLEVEYNCEEANKKLQLAKKLITKLK